MTTHLQKKHLYRLVLCCIISLAGFNKLCAQSDTARFPVKCDCTEAVRIVVNGKASYGYSASPRGFGNLQEMQSSVLKSTKVFSEEHNTAWYLLEFSAEGEAILDITPFQKTDDYDFVLFPYKDTATCNEIAAGRCKPVRSNLSRNDTDNQSVTGLSGTVVNEFKAEGPGSQFSRSIKVKSGDRYLLVLDNVYPNGKGHLLTVAMVRGVTIEGKIVDEEGKPKMGEVTLFNAKGVEQQKTQSDAQGFYKMYAKIEENMNYNLLFDADRSFFAFETINTHDLKNNDSSFANIRTVLPQLKKGAKYQVRNLNFYGDEARPLPRSLPSFLALYHLMKKNKDMIIRIEGHVNGGSKDSIKYQDLSERRAQFVYNYLLKKGISESRMTTIGYGDHFMLYTVPKNEYEQQANRRVEIKVVSVE